MIHSMQTHNNLEAQSCILSQQSASLHDAQDQYFVQRKKLSWLLSSTRKAKTDSLIYTLYITLVWILLYEVELINSTQSTLLVVTAHANWLLIFFIRCKWNQDNYSMSQKRVRNSSRLILRTKKKAVMTACMRKVKTDCLLSTLCT